VSPCPAGISNKFTKRHVDNFRDTTLTAASAAKARAEKKLERQADAIDKQQKKVESEVRRPPPENLHARCDLTNVFTFRCARSKNSRSVCIDSKFERPNGCAADSHSLPR
jgi:hypothetical protein